MKTAFHDDARAWLATELDNLSTRVPTSEDTFGLACLYFNVLRRTIQPARRTVHASRVLQSKLASTSLAPDVRDAVRAIVRASQAGESLVPFQSAQVVNIRFDDLLLNDWDIHHLHVGSLRGSRWARRAGVRRGPRSPSFIGGRNELLFACVRDSDLFLIDLLDHKSFEQKSLLETLHREWPAVLRPYLARGLGRYRPTDEPPEEIAPEDRRDARRSLSMIAAMDDGTAYFLPGGGASTATVGNNVVEAACRFLDSVTALEKRAHEREEFLRCAIEREGLVVGELDVALTFADAGRVVFYERNCDATLSTEFRVRPSGHLVSDIDGSPFAA